MKRSIALIMALMLCTALLSAAYAEASGSTYEYAFVRGNSEYQIYYLFDTDEGVVRNLVTNDTGVMVGTFTGSASSGFHIHWMEGWEEQFLVHDNGSGTLIDNDGFTYDFTAASPAEAEAILGQPGFHDMELE